LISFTTKLIQAEGRKAPAAQEHAMTDRLDTRETEAAKDMRTGETPRTAEPPFSDYAASRSVLVDDRSQHNQLDTQTIDFSQLPEIYPSADRGYSDAGRRAKAGESVASDGKADSSAGNFVPEKPSEKLQKKMKDFNIPPEIQEKALSEINQYGAEPALTARTLMEKNRVLAMGETHESPNPQRELGTEIMPDLKKAGATHLAIEAPERIQPALDEYMRTGKLDAKELPPLLRDKDYLDMLEAARKSGMKIVAVDANQKYVERSSLSANKDEQFELSYRHEHKPSVNRDKYMADNVGKILQENPNNKVVFWVGSAHLNHFEGPNHKTAGDLLKENYATATVKPLYGSSRNLGIYPLAELTSELKRPVAIPTRNATTVGDLKTSAYSLFSEHERNWDYIFVYPSR
jgi:hypothetical protein